MNKFFKKLAFTTAFAMVVTTVAPAAPAFAAKSPTLNAKSKTLLLGSEERNDFDFNLNNKVSGSKYKWTTSNAKVATVKSNGYVTAVGNGKAVISLKITLPTGKTTTLKANVTVKTNATSAVVTNVPETSIKVGETWNLNRSYTSEAGKTTDVTRFVITSENAADATINAETGHFTATKPGVYTVKVIFAQSAAKFAEGTYTAVSEDVTVNVAGITKLTQANKNTLNVEFGAPVEASDISVFRPVSTSKVNELIKKVTLSDDKKSAKVELYLDLAKDTTYGVELKGSNALTVVGADVNKITSKSTVEIITNEVVVKADGSATKIDVKLYNEDGVELNDSLLSYVELSSDSNTSYLNAAAKEITFYKVDDVATITAKVRTYEYDATGTEVAGDIDVQVIKAVSEASLVTSGVSKATVLLKGEDLNSFKTINKQVPLNDTDARLVAQVIESKAGLKDVEINSDTNAGRFVFETTDPSVLIVDAQGKLYPVKEGSAVVFVKYSATGADHKVIGTETIIVTAKRQVTRLTINNEETVNITLSNSALLNKTAKVTFKALDRLNVVDASETQKVKLEVLGNYTDVKKAEILADLGLVTPTNTDKKLEYTVSTVNFATAGTYQIKATLGTIVKVFTITVSVPKDTTVVNVKLALDTTSVDLKVDSDNKTKNVSVTLEGLASNGVENKDLTAASGYSLVYVAPGKTEEVAITAGNIDLLAGGKKAATGTYTVKAYTVSDTNVKLRLLATSQFTVTDTQSKVVLSAIDELVFSKTTETVFTNAMAEAAFAFKLGDDAVLVDANAKVNAIGTPASGYVYVTSVEFTRTVEGVTFVDVVAVNRTVQFTK